MFAKKIKTLSFAIALFFFSQAALSTLDISEGFTQELGLTISQKAGFHGIRANNPLNKDNWQEQPEWELTMQGELDWYVGFTDRWQFSLASNLHWLESAGEYWKEHKVLRDDSHVSLNEALFSFDIHEYGLRLMAGKTSIRQGSAVLFPVLDFLIKDTKQNNGNTSGKWLAGFSLQQGKANLGAWFSPPPFYEHENSDLTTLLHLGYTQNVHRFGLLYYHKGANVLGGYYSGQIGDSVIPYLEAAVSDHPLLHSFTPESVFSPSDNWSSDATCGLSYSPSFLNISIYLEYRYRSSGYESDDWNEIEKNVHSLRSLLPHNPSYYGISGSIASSLPYFTTPKHSFGLRFQNSRLLANHFYYNINTFFLAPDGLYLSAAVELSAIDRLKISLQLIEALSLGDKGEMAWWKDSWQIQLAAQWTARTFE